MTDDEKYLFDLTGYLVIREALSPDEVQQCNDAIDHHIDQLKEYPRTLAGDSKTLGGSSHRKDLGGMLAWEKPWCEPFRNMLIHPKVKPSLDWILGEGYRLDHGPGLIAMESGTEGGTLHGGAVERVVDRFLEAYYFQHGRVHCGLTVVEYLLADEGPGDGGVAVLPGSHKANFRCPKSLTNWETHREFVVEVHGKAGDAVIFTETLTHGTLPWTAEHQRRALLYKFSPGGLAYGGGAHDVSYPDYIDDMTEEQRGAMLAPQARSR
jgi:ectoine hydroxylase-related dioxygenase (phytanoyl-CoA dioxygenase family)